VEADVVHLGNDVPDARDISHGPAETAADALDLDFIVFVDEVDGTVANGKSADLSSVLDELDAHALPDGGVGLLGFDTDLLKYDTSRLRSALEGVRLNIEIEFAAGVVLVCLPELIGVPNQFSGCEFTLSH
jgi:hypothetical protein